MKYIVLFLGLLALGTQPADASDPSDVSAGGVSAPKRLVKRSAKGEGWHGEQMPAGMRRSNQKGEYVWERDGAVMVLVPAGAFPMGSEGGDSDELPVHEVYLDAYYIDKYEVSWAQWKRSGLPYADHQFSRRPYPEAPDWGILDDHPVMSVSWDYANQYADWAGKRLPSEAEWEKAARGTDGRRYPWGNEEPSFERAMWKEHPIADKKSAAVDCCSDGASPYGAIQMAGNVYEWCADTYQRDFYARSPRKNPVSQEASSYRVLRGGAFVLEKEDLRSALRYRLRPEDRPPYVGLRTVVAAPPAAE